MKRQVSAKLIEGAFEMPEVHGSWIVHLLHDFDWPGEEVKLYGEILIIDRAKPHLPSTIYATAYAFLTFQQLRELADWLDTLDLPVQELRIGSVYLSEASDPRHPYRLTIAGYPFGSGPGGTTFEIGFTREEGKLMGEKLRDFINEILKIKAQGG